MIEKMVWNRIFLNRIRLILYDETFNTSDIILTYMMPHLSLLL